MIPASGPPPPPPPPAPRAQVAKVLDNGETEEKEVPLEEFIREIAQWREALEQDEGHQETSVLVVVTPLKRVFLQNGPMCGIVALAEALQIMSENSGQRHFVTDPKMLFQEAVKQGYSKQGEMFSIEDMKLLAEFGTSKNMENKILQVSDHASATAEIMQHLLNGSPLLIPYDADRNHSPGLRLGHAAHWAVIHGFTCFPSNAVVQSISKELEAPAISEVFKVLHTAPYLTILQPNPTAYVSDNRHPCIHHIFDLVRPPHFIAHHGKSSRTAIWKSVDLFKSNQNLTEISPKILAEKDNFIFREGIQAGLQSKILFLR